VRSSFTSREGTIVHSGAHHDSARHTPALLTADPSDTPSPETDSEAEMEEPIIAGIAVDLGEAKITVAGVPDIPGKAAQIFTLVASTEANIDMIVQNVSAAATGLTDISFTLPKSDGAKVLRALEAARADVGFASLQYDDQIGKLALVGAGMRTNAGVSAKLFTALFEAGINIEMISTSEIRISVITRADTVNDAVRVVHTAFGLDGDDEAVVHGGTGR
jgi:aspartate kinase